MRSPLRHGGQRTYSISDARICEAVRICETAHGLRFLSGWAIPLHLRVRCWSPFSMNGLGRTPATRF